MITLTVILGYTYLLYLYIISISWARRVHHFLCDTFCWKRFFFSKLYQKIIFPFIICITSRADKLPFFFFSDHNIKRPVSRTTSVAVSTNSRSYILCTTISNIISNRHTCYIYIYMCNRILENSDTYKFRLHITLQLCNIKLSTFYIYRRTVQDVRVYAWQIKSIIISYNTCLNNPIPLVCWMLK